MKANTIVATVNPKKRVKTTVIIALYTILTLFSLSMGFWDLATDKRLFGILFLIAAAIFVILLLINGNAVYGTNLKYCDGMLYMKTWSNRFLPYDLDGGFLSDLKPAKTKVVSVPAKDIETILIGTKDYVKRNATESGKKFIKVLYPYEHSSKKSKRNMVTGIDIFYIETNNSDCAFMCIEDYDVKNVVDIINEISIENPNVSVRVNNREYKRFANKSE